MQKKRRSIRWKVIGILLICWLIPFSFLIGVMGVYIGSNHSDMTSLNYKDQLEFNNRICVERLNNAVADSRQASYDGEILRVKEEYRQRRIGYNTAQKSYSDYLTAKYQQSRIVSSAILWFEEDGRTEYSSVYSEKGNGRYQQIRTYWDRDHEAVAELAAGLDTSVGFLIRGDTVYLVRNLVDAHFQTQAVLVFVLNRSYCFGSLLDYPMQDGVCVWLNGEAQVLTENEAADDWDTMYQEMPDQNYKWVHGQLCVADTVRGDRYRFSSLMVIQESVTMFPFYGYQYVIAAMLLSLVPLLAIVLYVFRREVTYPVNALSQGAKRVEEGEFGYQIEMEAHNFEFQYLTDAFNRMSSHLKQQFDKIYQEEIALREARIMALQSHINPHFLNNTMEIINWEARLEGNVKVSKMIEALSNVMDAAMDRRKRPEVSLAEEMGYVSSYLYIMKERLGKRLTVETDLPKEVMSCPVPRLILQPVIENAIEHGVVPRGSGTVVIQGFYDEQYLYLEIKNDGVLTEKDRAKVNRLLDPEYNTSKEPSGNLGIANVNQRLRILFGEPCGLVISETQEQQVVSRLTIPLRRG